MQDKLKQFEDQFGEYLTNMETGECLAAIPFLRIDQYALRAAALAYAIDLYNK